MNYEVKRNISESRFEAINDQTVIGIIEYIPTDIKTITITHTGVSKEYEGMGIAASLNKKILEYASEENLKVVPLCSYSKMYIDRHPEYTHLLKR